MNSKIPKESGEPARCGRFGDHVSCCIAALFLALVMTGCTPKVAIEGGEKPIKIDMTVTLKIDQELDQFYAFQKKYEPPPTTQPTTLPTNPS